jgi:hypothetical protein
LSEYTDESDWKNVTVIAGVDSMNVNDGDQEFKTSNTDVESQLYEVVTMTLHEEYKDKKNDIAILEVQPKNVNGIKAFKAKPIRLHHPDVTNISKHLCRAAGFGAGKSGEARHVISHA